ncbi:MAG: 16S rRNA (cytosine(1402)-N(4))-methyltransferase [Nitrosomonadales bacterium]
MNKLSHLPVMPEEFKEYCIVKNKGNYLDCTYGRGGHVDILLNNIDKEAQVFIVDQDLSAIEHAKELKDPRLNLNHNSYFEFIKNFKKKTFFQEFLWTSVYLLPSLMMQKEDLAFKKMAHLI